MLIACKEQQQWNLAIAPPLWLHNLCIEKSGLYRLWNSHKTTVRKLNLLACEAPQHEDTNLDLDFLTFKDPVPTIPPSPPALTSEAKVLNTLPPQRKTMYKEGDGGQAYAKHTDGTLR
jgi:hypothetical protein